MTSSNGKFSALLAHCAGYSPVPVNSPHKGQWRGALMFSLICVWINGWVNNREAGDLRHHRAHYDVIVMYTQPLTMQRVVVVIVDDVLWNIGYPSETHLKSWSAPTVEHRWGLLSQQLPRYPGETNLACLPGAGGLNKQEGLGLGPHSGMGPFKISLKVVPKGSINNIPALVQIMAWHRPARRQAIVWTNYGYFD